MPHNSALLGHGSTRILFSPDAIVPFTGKSVHRIGQVRIWEERRSAKGYFYYPEVSNYPIATWNSPTLLALLSTSTDISVVLNASVVPCHSLRGAWGIGLIPHPHTRIQDPGRGVALEGSQQGL